MDESFLYWKYLRKGKRELNGWLQRIDAEIFGAILDSQNQQNTVGSVVEIGVHHGKSFIPLALALRPQELALCIDIFDNQDLNLDASGHGDLAIFLQNIERFGIDVATISILQCSSENVTPQQIIQQVGRVRFFSIDGGHWASIVQNDLCLAEKTLAPAGIIALDDYCRVEWPDVTAGYHLWQNATKSSIVPFAAGSNKLFLCHRDYASIYRAAIKTDFLRQFWTKTYASYAGDVDCYRVEPVEQDESRLLSAVRHFLEFFRPDLLVKLRKLRG